MATSSRDVRGMFSLLQDVRMVPLALLLVFPMFVSSSIISLSIEVMLLAMFAMSYNLLIGYTRIISFGHALFFGLGAYGTALVLQHLTNWTPAAIVFGIVLATIIAIPVGYVSLKRTGVYFAMLTLAFAQMAYLIVRKDYYGVTGGSYGLSGISLGNFGVPGLLSFQPTTFGYYYLVLTILALVYLTMQMIVNSAFGAVLTGIRENELRMNAAGYDVKSYKLTTFVLSGMYGAAGGAFYSPFYSVAGPNLFFWELTGDGLAMTLIGGMGTLIGPALGALLVVGVREFSSTYLVDWRLVLGVIFLIFILVFPGGLVELVRTLRRKAEEILP